VKLNLLILLFMGASCVLIWWLFGAWYEWGMANFDCVEGYWACRRHIAGPVALYVILGLGVWAVPAILLLRAWNKN